MSINCSSKCRFQEDGVCVMEDLPPSLPDARELGNSDCPYCQI